MLVLVLVYTTKLNGPFSCNLIASFIFRSRKTSTTIFFKKKKMAAGFASANKERNFAEK